jgi:hypothetical protein
MKTQQSSLFANLFGAKGGSAKPEESSSNPVIITSSSQPHVLQRKMKEKNMTHGETVTASISPVRVEAFSGKAVMYFCPLKEICILENVQEGDGGEIPNLATVELNIPATIKSGLYNLKNVRLTSNGTMQVMATAQTEWEWCKEHHTGGIFSEMQ